MNCYSLARANFFPSAVLFVTKLTKWVIDGAPRWLRYHRYSQVMQTIKGNRIGGKTNEAIDGCSVLQGNDCSGNAARNWEPGSGKVDGRSVLTLDRVNRAKRSAGVGTKGRGGE